MRWPLVVVALLIGVMLWDHFANDSTYTARWTSARSRAARTEHAPDGMFH